jgi:hypothetical protein
MSIRGLPQWQLEYRFKAHTANAKLVSSHLSAFGVWPTLEKVQ